MFVIKRIDNGYYFHEKGKIILFEDPNEANALINAFYQYAAARLVSERGPQGIFEIQHVISALDIVEQDFIETPPCGVVYFKDVKR